MAKVNKTIKVNDILFKHRVVKEQMLKANERGNDVLYERKLYQLMGIESVLKIAGFEDMERLPEKI